jgi:sRNA-binding regulator protein Hfq
MQSYFEARTAQRNSTLDTDQPGTRHIQNLIRRKAPVTIEIGAGRQLEGVIRWQDLQFLALDTGGDQPLTLVNRHALILLREQG